jgi:hypothetical protein
MQSLLSVPCSALQRGSLLGLSGKKLFSDEAGSVSLQLLNAEALSGRATHFPKAMRSP